MKSRIKCERGFLNLPNIIFLIIREIEIELIELLIIVLYLINEYSFKSKKKTKQSNFYSSIIIQYHFKLLKTYIYTLLQEERALHKNI